MTELMQAMIEQLRELGRRIGALERREYTQGGGSGDMLKSVYDTNNDGTVNSAENSDTVDSQHASAFAVAAKGVTNGDSHDHAGGDGAQIDHGGLAGLADDDHTQYYNQTRGDARYALLAKGVTNGDSHDHAGGDGAQIDHGGLGGLADDDHTQYLKANGTRGLSADWDAGSFEIRAQTLESDVATGTAPLTIASTTLVANLNADKLDGYDAGSFREKLSAARTYYVRTDGNDSNTGLVNTSGGAFLTIQKAIDTVAALDINGYAITIQIGDGTYTAGGALKNVVGYAAAGDLIIQGNSGTPTNVLVQPASGDCFAADGVPVCWDIKDMKLDPGSGGAGLRAAYGSYLRFSGLDFAAGTYHMWANAGSRILCIGNYTISGNASYGIWVTGNSYIAIQNRTITFTANIAVTNFVYVRTCSFLVMNGCTFSLGGYSVTGVRYIADLNGVINTNGGGASYFPGDSAGRTATGGQYA